MNKKIVPFIVVLMYIPICFCMINNVGLAVSNNGDMAAYIEWIMRMYNGYINHDLRYAFGGSSFGYGSLFFSIISIIILPFWMAFKSDVIVLFMIRSVSLIALFLLFFMIKKLSNRMVFSSLPVCLVYFVIAIVPTTELLVGNIHPEIVQLLVYLYSIDCALSFIESNSKKDFTKLIISSGMVIGLKITGVILLVWIGVVIIFCSKYSIRERIKTIVFYAAFAGGLGMVFAIPNIIILGPYKGITNFLTELNFFRKGATGQFRVSEFDYYESLSSKKEAIIRWLVHPFQYGYFGCVLFGLMIIALLVFTIKEFKNKVPIKKCLATLISFIINLCFFMYTSNSVSSYYLYSAIIVIVIVVFNEVSRINYVVKYLIFFLIVFASIPRTYRSYQTALEKSAWLMERSRCFKDVSSEVLFDENNTFVDNVLIPTSMPLSLTLRDINWVPDYDKLKVLDNNRKIYNDYFMKEYSYYWTLDDFLRSEDDFSGKTIFIDKRNEMKYRLYGDFFAQKGKSVVYEDLYCLVLGDNRNNREKFRGTIYDNGELIGTEGWVVSTRQYQFEQNIDISDKIVCSFIVKEGQFRNLRIVFKDGTNIVDYYLGDSSDFEINKENRVEFSLNQCVSRNGCLDFRNIDCIEIGADVDTKTDIENIVLEIK